MQFVMILVVIYNFRSADVATAEFNSFEACDLAARAFIEETTKDRNYIEMKYVCSPKGAGR